MVLALAPRAEDDPADDPATDPPADAADAADEIDPDAPAAAPDEYVPAPIDPTDPRRAVREAIIQRLRCENIDPTECYIPDDPFAGEDLPEDVFDEDGKPLPITEAIIETLLADIRVQLELREAQRVADAGAELASAQLAELQFFGVEDHYLDPPTEYYTDPSHSISRSPALLLDQVDPADFDYPLVINDKVQRWMEYFLGRGRKHYVRYLGRKPRFEPMISAALAEAGLPQDLIYQAMIESGFNTHAYSWAKAAGVWQFIPGTGRHFGMRIDWWVDMRRDPAEATRGASEYMTYLYEMFDDWYLASAAYNAGEGKIQRAIKRYDTRDFWELCQGDYLKPETKNYVPKILAAAILGKYPERYGLTQEVTEWSEPLAYDIVTVGEATDIGLIAEITGATEEQIQDLNPALRQWCTPPGDTDFDVHIPPGAAEGFHERLAQIPPEERLTFKRYKVRSDDSLSKIASRHGVSVDSVVTMNNIRNRNRISVGQYLVIPVRAAPPKPRDIRHVVVTGDTLHKISNRYGVTIDELKDWNTLDSDTIALGTTLTIHLGGWAAVAVAASSSSVDADASADATTATTQEPPADAPASAASSDATADATPAPPAAAPASTAPTASTAPITHIVAAGDTLGAIALRYDTSVADIKAANSLTSDRIQIGQKLDIRAGAASTVRKITYRVQSGDTLWDIARAHGVSLADLKAWNGIGSRSIIHQGDRLEIHLGGGSGSAPAPARVHEVQSGETLWDIARAHGVSVGDLKKWNRLRGNTIRPGQKLIVR